MKLQSWGKFLFFLICSGIFSLYVACPVLGQNNIKEIKILNQEVVKLYKKGEYSQAIPRAQTVVKMTRLILGQNNTSVAVSLNNLAALNAKLGDYASAEILYLQSLQIFMVSERLDHPLFSKTIIHLTTLYKKSGNHKMATALEKQFLEIRENRFKTEPSSIEASMNHREKIEEKRSDKSKINTVLNEASKLSRK